MIRFLALALLALSATAHADVPVQTFVPESGFYWNPQQPGRGYAIEIQDRTLFITAYVYTEEANAVNRVPLWFSAVGLVQEGRLGSGVVYRFGDELLYSTQGQCLDCPFTDPVTEGTGRAIDITFDTPTRAVMTIDGERIDLQRFWFSGSISDPIFALLGQWMIVTDFTSVDAGVLPFDGDLLELGFEGFSGGESVAEGFRGGTAITVAGAYNANDDFYVLIVAERQNEFLAYYFPGIQFGTNQFFGLAERYTPGTNLTGFGFPMQGYRISDRTHTEQVIRAKRSTREAGPARPQRPRAPETKGEPAIAPDTLNQMVRTLEAQLSTKQAP